MILREHGRARGAAALAAIPARIDTALLFPGANGRHLDLHNWRAKHWRPALDSAVITYRPPYALRHTYAAFSIAAGVSTFELSRFMGTSLEQIDKTYGHLLPDSLDRARSALDLFVGAASEAEAAFTD
jgi:integrase